MEFEVKNHFLEEKEDFSFPLVLKKKELKRGYRNPAAPRTMASATSPMDIFR